MSLDSSMYSDPQTAEMHECEFTAEFEDIITRSNMSEKIKQEIKAEPGESVDPTNIIVTKYEDPTRDMLGVEPTLELDNKGKIIEVELLPSSHLRNIQNKSNFATLLNKSIVKRPAKRKLEGSENKKMSESELKKRKMKHCSMCGKEYIKNHELVCKRSSEEGKTLHSLAGALCSKCGKNFSSNYNLKRHMTSCKLCPDDEKGPRFVCQCGRTYSQEWDMKKHKMKCKDGKKKCKQCLMNNCNLLFYHKAQLITHMKRDHNMSIQDPEVLNFSSFEDFLLWKEREEEETYTYYSKQTGSNVTGVSVNTYYVCQHDGSDRTHSTSPRKTERRNKKGRIKTGRLCWSQMNVKQFKDGTVRVTYFPSHTHAVSITDTEHHPLPSSISIEIQKRLSDVKTEPVQEVEVPEMKKTKKKRFGVTLRTLRSLARKNRNLFRITADAIQDSDEHKFSLEEKPSELFPLSGTSEEASYLQVLVTDQEEHLEHSEDREEHPSCCKDGPEEDVFESCFTRLDQLKNLLAGGKMNEAQVTQLNQNLKALVDKCHEEEEGEEVPEVNQSELQEVLYEPDSPLSTEAFPLQGNMSISSISSISLRDDLKSEDKTIYQIVPLEKDKPSSDASEFLYQNAVELVGSREFIIITGDHTQYYQTVDPGTHFDLN